MSNEMKKQIDEFNEFKKILKKHENEINVYLERNKNNKEFINSLYWENLVPKKKLYTATATNPNAFLNKYITPVTKIITCYVCKTTTTERICMSRESFITKNKYKDYFKCDNCTEKLKKQEAKWHEDYKKQENERKIEEKRKQENIKKFRKMSTEEYYQTSHWKEISDEAIEEIGKCQLCGRKCDLIAISPDNQYRGEEEGVGEIFGSYYEELTQETVLYRGVTVICKRCSNSIM